MKKILLILAAAVLFTACPDTADKLDPNQQENRDTLMKQIVPGVWEGTTTLIVFSESDHQLYNARKQYTTYIMDETADEYVKVEFESRPVLNKDVQASVIITAGMGKLFSATATFRVLKIENDLIYIWSDDEGLGAVMYWKQ